MVVAPRDPNQPDKTPALLAGDRIRLIIQGPDAAAAMEELTGIFTADWLKDYFETVFLAIGGNPYMAAKLGKRIPS